MSNPDRQLFLDALALTAQICVGYDITDPHDVSRINTAALRLLAVLGQDASVDQILDLIEGGDE